MSDKQSGRFRSIAKRQHYHMNFILKNFRSKSGHIQIVDKKTKKEEPVRSESDYFVAIELWSNEIEETIGAHGIERRAQAQIRRILNGESISCHQALSEYMIFWKIRHLVKDEKPQPTQFMEGWGTGRHPEHNEIDAWCNENDKVQVHPDGTISGRDSLSQEIKNSIPTNLKQLENTKWEVLYSEKGGFISADCYDLGILPITPHYLLTCLPQDKWRKGVIEVTQDDVEIFNDEARKQCREFYFYYKED